MASTYSDRLRLEIMAAGENSGTWGAKANTVFELIEEALSGYLAVAMADANVTLTASNAVSDQSRNMVLKATGVHTTTRDLIAPAEEKLYVIHNATTGSQSVRIKTSGGTAVTVANGDKVLVYCDGTDFYEVGKAYQASDATLTALAGVSTAADKLPYFTGSDTASVTDLSAFGRTLIDDAAASNARTTLGLVIGTDVQAYSALLASVAGLTPTDSVFVVGNGTAFVAESGATARTSLGLGSLSTASTINDGNWSGTDLAVANGGTGSSSATDARTALGLVIGTDVQAYDADLAAIAALTTTAFGRSVLDRANAAALRTLIEMTANAQSLVTAANYAAMRTLLDLEPAVDFAAITTSSTFPVGATLWMRYTSGTSLTAGSSTSGANVETPAYTGDFGSAGLSVASGQAQTGTWRNDNGTTLRRISSNNDGEQFGYMTRTA